MTDATLIQKWKRCERAADALGMAVATTGVVLTVQGTDNTNSFRSFYSCNSVDELLGYLEGVTDGKSKLESASASAKV